MKRERKHPGVKTAADVEKAMLGYCKGCANNDKCKNRSSKIHLLIVDLSAWEAEMDDDEVYDYSKPYIDMVCYKYKWQEREKKCRNVKNAAKKT